MAYIGTDLKSVTQDDMDGPGGWKCLEPGEYAMVVTDSDYKSNRAGNGANLMLAVQTVDGKAKWREFLALDNKSEAAVRIARAKLKQLAIAVGHKNPDYIGDSAELHGKPFLAVVKTEVANDPKFGDLNGEVNRIAAFKPMNGAKLQADAEAKQATAKAKSEDLEDLDSGLPF